MFHKFAIIHLVFFSRYKIECDRSKSSRFVVCSLQSLTVPPPQKKNHPQRIHIVIFLLSGSRHIYHADEWWPQPLPGLCGSAPRKPPEVSRLCPWSGGSSPLATVCQSSTASTDETSRPPARATSRFQPVRGEPAQGACPEPPAKKEHTYLFWSVDGGFLPRPHPRP